MCIPNCFKRHRFFQIFSSFKITFYVYGCFACQHVGMHNTCMSGAYGGYKIKVMHDSKPPCGYWGLNPDPLQKHEVLLSVEPSPPQPLTDIVKMLICSRTNLTRPDCI